jgi:DNA replication and repair protein RecF
MRVEHLSLTNFRNYARLEVTLPPGPLLLYGENAQGKTSLLEAIYYLATSRSVWATSDRQLLNWQAENDVLPYARLAAEAVNRHSSLVQIDITLMRQASEPDAKLKKQIRVNGLNRRQIDLLGELNVVMFLPQDLALVEGAPIERRRYLNITLGQTDRAYAEALNNYEKVLEQRNALLRNIAIHRATSAQLTYWDEKLTEAGSVIIAGRQRLLRELEVLAQDVHSELTGGAETLELEYQPSFQPVGDEGGQLSFDALGLDLNRQLTPEEIVPQFREALEAGRAREIERGMTLIGPQRDELRFHVNNHDLALYGSRGQARTAVLAIKLAELDWMRKTIGEWPILLLDEFIAELDAKRRGFLLERIDGVTQSILTTTEREIFTPQFLSKAVQWRIHSGRIVPEHQEQP